jgi:hypothetical protein
MTRPTTTRTLFMRHSSHSVSGSHLRADQRYASWTAARKLKKKMVIQTPTMIWADVLRLRAGVTA